MFYFLFLLLFDRFLDLFHFFVGMLSGIHFDLLFLFLTLSPSPQLDLLKLLLLVLFNLLFIFFHKVLIEVNNVIELNNAMVLQHGVNLGLTNLFVASLSEVLEDVYSSLNLLLFEFH